MKTLWYPWRPDDLGRSRAAHEAALAKMPPSPWVLYYLGFLRDGRRGLEVLQGLEGAPKRYAFMLQRLGWSRLHQDDYAGAVRALARACRAKPLDWRAHGWHAEALLCLGKTKPALAALDRAAKTAPSGERADAAAWRGSLLLWIGRYREALKLLDAACAQGAFWARGWRGAARLKLGQAKEALADLDEAIKAFPADDEARLWRAETLCALGRPQEALPELARLPPGLWPRWVRARACALLGDEDGLRGAVSELPPQAAAFVRRKKRLREDDLAGLAAGGLELAKGYRRSANYGNAVWLGRALEAK